MKKLPQIKEKGFYVTQSKYSHLTSDGRKLSWQIRKASCSLSYGAISCFCQLIVISRIPQEI